MSRRAQLQGHHVTSSDDDEVRLDTPSDALRAATTAGDISEVLRILSLDVRRVASSSADVIDHFEFVPKQTGYRDAGVPLERMLDESALAEVWGHALESLALKSDDRDHIATVLQYYFQSRASLFTRVRPRLSERARRLLSRATPEALRITWDGLRGLSKQVATRPLRKEELDELTLGLPPLRKGKFSQIQALVQALAESDSPDAAAVLEALHREGLPREKRWLRARARAQSRETKRAAARSLPRSHGPATLTRLLPTATNKTHSRQSPNPFARVHIVLVWLLSWFASWAAHVFFDGAWGAFLGATLPYAILAAHKFNADWIRKPGRAFLQTFALACQVGLFTFAVQDQLGSAASGLILTPLFALVHWFDRVTDPRR